MWFLLAAAAIALTPPKPTAWVTDAPRLLSEPTRAKLDTRLRAYRNERGPDVVLWIAKDLPEEPRETWCFRTFNSWGIGRKYRNDGVVLFVFANGDKHCWITTGAGVVKDLSNAEAVQICREIVSPSIRNGMPERGIIDGLEAILKELERRQ